LSSKSEGVFQADANIDVLNLQERRSLMRMPQFRFIARRWPTLTVALLALSAVFISYYVPSTIARIIVIALAALVVLTLVIRFVIRVHPETGN
jgi:Flp pilus assembly protein TadB